MKLPLIFYKNKNFYRKPPRHIVIHSSICLINNPLTNMRIDDKKDQNSLLKKEYIIKDKFSDIPFHYTVEKIKDDYNISMWWPNHCYIPYFDFIKNNDRMIHIGLSGDFNYQLAPPRLYELLAYRLLTPLMFWYKIPLKNIYFHSELDKKKKDCPGEMIFKDILIQKIMKYQMVNASK